MTDLSKNTFDFSKNQIYLYYKGATNNSIYPKKYSLGQLYCSKENNKENSLNNSYLDFCNKDKVYNNIKHNTEYINMKLNKFINELDNKVSYDNNKNKIIRSERLQSNDNKRDLSFRQFVSRLDLHAATKNLNSILEKQRTIEKKDDCNKIKTYTDKKYRDFFEGDVLNPFFNSDKSTNTLLDKYTSIHIPTIEKEHIDISVNIQNIDDLITLADNYPLSDNIEYNIDMKSIHAIYEPLKKLRNMIGMHSLKENIVDQILYFIQNLQTTEGDFMHTCIYGPPGTGKTEIAKIMGELFSNLGVLKKKIFRKVTRADLIAGYLGQTAIKTKEVVRSALGGVLFIDEAYALGNAEKRDSFSKECIDTLCESLSDHKNNLMVIIAGYENDLEKCFFSYNQGLQSRFTWRFKTDNYSPDELKEIFIKKIKDAKWKIHDDSSLSLEWFEKNNSYFKYYGRDMETLFSKVKIAHSKRVFCLPEKEKRLITMDDLELGFKKFLENDEVKKRKTNRVEELYKSLYM